MLWDGVLGEAASRRRLHMMAGTSTAGMFGCLSCFQKSPSMMDDLQDSVAEGSCREQ